MSAATDDNFDKFIKTISTFKSMKDDLNEEFYSDIEEIVNKAMEQVSDRTGKYLHWDICEHQPHEDTCQKIIDNVPSSLSYENKFGQLPIHSAVACKASVGYVPLLAKEGFKHQVGGDNARGGLLVGNYLNVLQWLASQHFGYDDDDAVYLEVILKLRESKLLRKGDIKEQDLLFHACGLDSLLRFDFLVGWCPEGLKNHKIDGLPLIHAVVKKDEYDSIRPFYAFLKIALKYYPNDLGLLFQKDDEGLTACERAFEEFEDGEGQIMAFIGDLIPFDDPKLPILHHVAMHAPQYMDCFACRYPSASYFRDREGRTLNQATLTSGQKDFTNTPMFFLQMSDEQVREIDPGSDLYPFMVAASGETCDISAVYTLLRRNPSLAHRNKPKRAKRKRKMK